MRKPLTVLLTKKLTKEQNQLLNVEGVTILEHEFIKIKHQELRLTQIPDVLVFTSKNAIKSLESSKENYKKLLGKPCLCVGVKTAALAKEKGFIVDVVESYAKDLVKHFDWYKDKNIAFFSGSLRRNEIPEYLQINNFTFTEYVVYTTVLNGKGIKTSHEAILFFSPSAVESYVQSNNINHKKCFCIGNTTAIALKEYTQNVFVADRPSIEKTIEKFLWEVLN